MNFEKLWVIASDVYRKTVKSPSFLIGVFMPFIVVLIGFLIGAIMNRGQETTTIVSQVFIATKISLSKVKTSGFSQGGPKTVAS